MKEKHIFNDYVRTLSKEKKTIKKYIDENLKKNYIRLSKANTEQSITFISKSDNKIQLYINFRKLNKIIKKRNSTLLLVIDL